MSNMYPIFSFRVKIENNSYSKRENEPSKQRLTQQEFIILVTDTRNHITYPGQVLQQICQNCHING